MQDGGKRDAGGALAELAGDCRPKGDCSPDVGGCTPDAAAMAVVVEEGPAVTIGGTKPGCRCVMAVGKIGGPEAGGQPVMLGIETGDIIAMNELKAAVSAPTCFSNASKRVSAAPAAALGSGATLDIALEAAGGWAAAEEAAGG